MVKRPNGFVAKCLCGNITGAMDFDRTERSDAASTLGRWLFSGKTVEPRFGSFSVVVQKCECKEGDHGQ